MVMVVVVVKVVVEVVAMVVEVAVESGDSGGGWKKFVTEYMDEYSVLFGGTREEGLGPFVCSVGQVGMCHAG